MAPKMTPSEELALLKLIETGRVFSVPWGRFSGTETEGKDDAIQDMIFRELAYHGDNKRIIGCALRLTGMGYRRLARLRARMERH